jgi:hypothetical protein
VAVGALVEEEEVVAGEAPGERLPPPRLTRPQPLFHLIPMLSIRIVPPFDSAGAAHEAEPVRHLRLPPKLLSRQL